MAFDNYDKCSLLLPMDGTNNGTTFTDWSPVPKTVTSTNAKTLTNFSKYYGSSLYSTGSNEFLSVNMGTALGEDDFTICFWLAPNLTGYTTGWVAVLAIGNDATNGSFNLVRSADTLRLYQDYYNNAFNGAEVAIDLVNAQFNHVAVTRQSLVTRVFINGVLGLTRNNPAGSNITQSNIRLFARSNSTVGYRGWMNDFLIIKGAALWTANFTPPTRLIGQVSGTVTDISGVAASRIITVLPRTNPTRVFQTTSSAVDGAYSLRVPATEVTRVALAQEVSVYNDLVARIIPE